MQSFEEIYAIAAERKGGTDQLEALIAADPFDTAALAKTADDRWLSTMARALFQAGFNWNVVNAKWDGFEEAFHGFDPAHLAFLPDEEIDHLLGDKRIIRNGAKISAVFDNARFVRDVADSHGSFGAYVGAWPDEDYAGLLQEVARRGARLGSVTGQRVMRMMGRDGYILSKDVVARLVAAGVVDKPPTGKRDQAAVQDAFNQWRKESGRSLTSLSKLLGYSI